MRYNVKSLWFQSKCYSPKSQQEITWKSESATLSLGLFWPSLTTMRQGHLWRVFTAAALRVCTQAFRQLVLYSLPNHLPSSSFGIAFKVILLTARKIFLLYSRTSFLNPKQNYWCSLHLTPCSFSKPIFLYWIKISHYKKKVPKSRQ